MSGALLAAAHGRPRGAFLTDHTISDSAFAALPGTASALAQFLLDTDGVAKFNRNAGSDGTYAGEWLVSGAVGDYECQFSAGTGALAGISEAWVSLSTARSVSLSATRSTDGNTTNTGTCTVKIRKAGSSSVITSCGITLSASATASA